jgi:GT2 family glycosyltransferase
MADNCGARGSGSGLLTVKVPGNSYGGSNLFSIIVPTFNGAGRIGHCLDALLRQNSNRSIEILVVNDGSTDDTAEVVSRYSGVCLINQANSGPAAARNRGALKARGGIVLFTDDDCVPAPGWLEAMLAPFQDPEVVGVKGAYRSHQRGLAARFVQVEYEDRYRLMKRLSSIDFVDTYSAAFRRDGFLAMTGYDTSFPLACAEDIELSYRMSARGLKMKFAPEAIVFHTHPDTLSKYLRKKYKFAFWRVIALRKNPSKVVKDSHTPQLMKLQLLFCAGAISGASLRYDDATWRPCFTASPGGIFAKHIVVHVAGDREGSNCWISFSGFSRRPGLGPSGRSNRRDGLCFS